MLVAQNSLKMSRLFTQFSFKNILITNAACVLNFDKILSSKWCSLEYLIKSKQIITLYFIIIAVHLTHTHARTLIVIYFYPRISSIDWTEDNRTVFFSFKERRFWYFLCKEIFFHWQFFPHDGITTWKERNLPLMWIYLYIHWNKTCLEWLINRNESSGQ